MNEPQNSDYTNQNSGNLNNQLKFSRFNQKF